MVTIMARSALLGGKTEAGTDARRCVQKAEGKLFPHFLEQGAHLLGLGTRPRGEGHGRSEQIELLELRVLRCRLFQRAASLDHIGKVHQYPVGHAQYNIKVAQTDIGVDAQRSMSGGGQGRADPPPGRFFRCPLCRRPPHMQFPKVSAPFRLYSGFFLIWAKRRGYREGVGAVFSTRTTRWVMDVPGMV